jgi:hypothetical protein
LEHDVRVGTQDDSSRINKVMSRTQYVVPVGDLTPIGTAGEQDSDTETHGVWFDALISVWWDQPPCDDSL